MKTTIRRLMTDTVIPLLVMAAIGAAILAPGGASSRIADWITDTYGYDYGGHKTFAPNVRIP